MTLGLERLDYVIFFIYFVVVATYGYWVYKNKGNKSDNSQDFFLAEGSLTWWAIGSSIIASNISAEQFIGMSGQAFQLGIAISVYEIFGGVILLIVATYFLPMYLNNKIYTMPQFLSKRYNDKLATMMAIFWLFLYVFVNLTSIIYLGGLSLEKMTGISFMACACFLTVFAIIITLGGMKVIGYTDVIQVVCLIFGGLATTYLALELLSNRVGTGGGMLEGLSLIKAKADSHLHMIFTPNQYQVHDGKGGFIDAYKQLPGIAMFLIGGQWINNLNYFGCNQYITQRALGADIKTARSGLLFAGVLKMLMPIIVVLPGLAAYVIFQENAEPAIVNGITQNGIVKPDNAYPILLNLLPVGLKGLAFAALTAAIVASLAGKANSISTIYVLDIHKKFINPTMSDKKTIWTGRIAIVFAFIIALLISPQLKNLGQAYEYIQKYTGYVSPGILSIFLLGFFWKKNSSQGAFVAAILSVALSAFLEIYFPDMPFLNRMATTFWICVLVQIGMSYLFLKGEDHPNAFEVKREWFKVTKSFQAGAIAIIGFFVLVYVLFW